MNTFRIPAVASLLVLSLAACTPAQPDKTPEASAVASSRSAITSSMKATASTTVPAAFIGKWDSGPKPCGYSYRSDMQLDVTATELTFFESGGSVKSVKVNGPNDIVAEVAMSGEGEEWKKSLHMVLSEDGKALTLDDGKMGARVRCPA